MFNLHAGIGIEPKSQGLQYTVQAYPHGWVISAPVPIDALTKLLKTAKSFGFDEMDMGVGAALNSIVVTNKKGRQVFRDEIARRNASLPKEEQWLRGTDTGISSCVIFSVMTGRNCYSPGFPANTPADPDDFGRCHRLLSIFPEWRGRLHEVAEKHADWKPLIERWDEMTRLYEEESPSGKCPELYDLMQRLNAK